MLKTLINGIKVKCGDFFLGGVGQAVKAALTRFHRALFNKTTEDSLYSKQNAAAEDEETPAFRSSKIKAFFSKLPFTKKPETLRFFNPNMLNLRTKELLRVYGIFTAMTIVMLTVTGAAVKLTSERWERGLRAAVEKTLAENADFDGKAGAFVRIKSPLALSAALFELEPPLSDGADYAIVIRVQTMYGPFPAVFVYGKESGARFIGFASISGRVKRLLEDNDSDPRIRYWTAKVPAIMRTAVTRAVATERE